MLTKTKKWFIVLVFAFTIFLLAACTPKEEKVNPVSLEVFVDAGYGEDSVLIGGALMELSVEAYPKNAYTDVTWVSKNTNIATVNAEGKVTGILGGRATIVATSTYDTSVKAEIVITVLEDAMPTRVLLNAQEYIKANVPEFVVESFSFPVYRNTLVSAKYFDSDGVQLEDNRYIYDYEYDVPDLIKCELEYLGNKIDFIVVLNVVEDPELNDFTSMAAARAEVTKYLSDYLDVTETFVLPETLEEVYALNNSDSDFGLDVRITWDSGQTSVLDVIENSLKYIRPFDDTNVTIEVYYVCGNNSSVSRHILRAIGYTQEEKMDIIIANSLPQDGRVIEGENITLRTRDADFGAKIDWATDQEDVLSARGKMNPFLENQTTAKLTATITYTGSKSVYSFTEDVEINIVVKPAANDAQKVILSLDQIFEDEFPTYFPWGLPGREGNVLPVPTKVGGESEFKDVAITWTVNEEGLFDTGWELQKQYLRYHSVILTYSVTIAGDTASGELLVNVGVAELENTIYIGGRNAARSDIANPIQRWDELHTFSTDEQTPPAGSTPNGAYSTAYRSWTGFTFYYDLVSEDGEVTRYQYFANDPYTYYIYEAEAGSANGVQFDEDGNMTGKILSVTGLKDSNYQYMVLYNMTEHDVAIPITYLNYKGSTVSHDINGSSMIRQVAVAFDGWRSCFIANADGEVIFGSGDATPIETYLIENAEVDEEGEYTLPEYLIIPPGGFAWDPYSSQSIGMDVLGSLFCKEGNVLVYDQFTPKNIFETTLYNPFAPTN